MFDLLKRSLTLWLVTIATYPLVAFALDETKYIRICDLFDIDATIEIPSLSLTILKRQNNDLNDLYKAVVWANHHPNNSLSDEIRTKAIIEVVTRISEIEQSQPGQRFVNTLTTQMANILYFALSGYFENIRPLETNLKLRQLDRDLFDYHMLSLERRAELLQAYLGGVGGAIIARYTFLFLPRVSEYMELRKLISPTDMLNMADTAIREASQLSPEIRKASHSQ